MLRRIIYFILALCISAAPILVFSTPAFAAPINPTSQASPSGGGFICSTGTANSNISANYLPINRWGGVSASEFTYLPGGPIGTIVNLPHQSNRMIVGLILSAGNSMWSATSSLTSIAEQFCFGSQAAVQANYVTAALWRFISQGYILSILIVVGVILLVWRARKGTKIGKEVIRIVLIAAVIMTLGITSSKTTSADVASGNYPKYSPAWIVSTVYGALSAVVSVPLSGINSTIANTVQLGNNQSSTKGYGTGCAAYTDALLTKYKQSYGPNVASQSEAVVPGVVNGIWDNSGLQATAIAQFGDNNYTSSAYCHLYEQEAGISPTAQIAIARAAGKIPPNPNPQSLAFLPEGASQQEQVASMVGWAACTSPNSTALQPQPGWSGVQYTPGLLQQIISPGGALASAINGPNTITASDCQKWWSTPASGWNYQGTALYWGTSTSTISSATANAPQAANFLFNFFGDSSTGAFIVAIVYAISSLTVLVTFGLLALAVIVAKFGLLLLMALFIIFLAVDLVPGKSGGHHATKFLKQGVSFLCLAIGVEAILGLVAVMTSIITRFGVGVAGSGIVGMLWVAISPVAAIWSVHHILKTFRIPSPFRPDAAMGWAAAAGAGGFLTGAMADRLTGGYQKLRSEGVRGLRSGAHRAGGALSPKPDKRLYGPRGSGSQMPSKNFDGNAGWQSKTNSSGHKTTTGASSGGGATEDKTESASTGTRSTSSSGASAAAGGAATTGTSTRGHKWAGHQRPAASRSAETAAVATAALDKVKNQNQAAAAKPQRWSLNRPAAKPRDINGVPYRSPSQMRLEGAQKTANDRKAMRNTTREAKKFVRQQAGPLPQRLANATGERAQLAWARAKANPGKTVARAAGYGAAAMILPVGAPVAAGLALHYGTKKARTAMAERPAKKAEKRAQLSYVSRNILRDKSKRKPSVGSVATATSGKNATQKYRARTKATSTS